MSEDEMLKCLIAFVLGYLFSYMMRGNGMSVGGQESSHNFFKFYPKKLPNGNFGCPDPSGHDRYAYTTDDDTDKGICVGKCGMAGGNGYCPSGQECCHSTSADANLNKDYPGYNASWRCCSKCASQATSFCMGGDPGHHFWKDW